MNKITVQQDLGVQVLRTSKGVDFKKRVLKVVNEAGEEFYAVLLGDKADSLPGLTTGMECEADLKLKGRTYVDKNGRARYENECIIEAIRPVSQPQVQTNPIPGFTPEMVQALAQMLRNLPQQPDSQVKDEEEEDLPFEYPVSKNN